MTTTLLRRAADGGRARGDAGRRRRRTRTHRRARISRATEGSATTLSIRTVRAAVAPGGSTAVTGVLLIQVWAASPGHTVTLEAKPQGTDDFVPVAEAVTRDHGGVRAEVTPSTTTRYRWHYAGDDQTSPSVSGIARVRVRTPDHPATRLNTTLSIRLAHRVDRPG